MEYRNFGFGFIRAAIGGGSGGGGGLNLFTQMEEPEIKDGIWIKTDSKYKHVVCDDKVLYEDGAWGDVLTLPFNCYNGGAVLWHGDIHVISNNASATATSHYKFDGNSWTSVSTFPYNFEGGSVVVYNDEIHVIGGITTQSYKSHYKFNGSAWTSVGSIPEFKSKCGVVFNNEIHIVGGYNGIHYKFNGTAWTSVGSGLYSVYSSAVVYNGCIYIMGGKERYRKIYKYDGKSWIDVDTALPYNFGNGCAVVYNGDIHIFGGKADDIFTPTYNYTSHYKFDGTKWTSVSTSPKQSCYSCAACDGQDIYLIGGNQADYCVFTSPQALFENKSIILVRSNHNGVYLTNFCDVSAITGDNNRFLSGFDDVWYFDAGSFDLNCEMYYGNETEWVKFKN